MNKLAATAATTLASASLLVLASCTASDDAQVPQSSSVSTSHGKESIADAKCVPSPRANSDGALRGDSTEGTVWALGGKANTREQFKLVLRMTGSGELSAAAIGPKERRIRADEVVPHPSSNFNRPGDEWGVFYSFDRPGCWQLVFERSNIRGLIDIAVR